MKKNTLAKSGKIAVLFTAMAMLIVGTGIASAAFTPVDVDFGNNNDGLGDFTTDKDVGGNSDWSLEDESLRAIWNNVGGEGWDALMANREISGISGSDFQMTTVLDVDGSFPPDGDNERVFLTYLHSGADATSLNPQFYYLPNNDGGSFAITGPSGNIGDVVSGVGRLDENSPWTLSLEGTYDGSSDLTLTGSISDGTISEQITRTLGSADVPSGEYMGFGSRLVDAYGSSGDDDYGDFKSFTIIPEPSTLALLGLAGLLLMKRRRL